MVECESLKYLENLTMNLISSNVNPEEDLTIRWDTFVNNIENLVIIVDSEDNLCFVNDYGKKFFKQIENYLGKKYYNVFNSCISEILDFFLENTDEKVTLFENYLVNILKIGNKKVIFLKNINDRKLKSILNRHSRNLFILEEIQKLAFCDEVIYFKKDNKISIGKKLVNDIELLEKELISAEEKNKGFYSGYKYSFIFFKTPKNNYVCCVYENLREINGKSRIIIEHLVQMLIEEQIKIEYFCDKDVFIV